MKNDFSMSSFAVFIPNQFLFIFHKSLVMPIYSYVFRCWVWCASIVYSAHIICTIASKCVWLPIFTDAYFSFEFCRVSSKQKIVSHKPVIILRAASDDWFLWMCAPLVVLHWQSYHHANEMGNANGWMAYDCNRLYERATNDGNGSQELMLVLFNFQFF